MAADRQELAREAKVVGLRDFSTPSLEAVERRRWQLWTVAFVVMVALAGGLVLMASSGARSVGLFKHLPVRVGLVFLTMGFALYVLEKEVHLRRLTRLLLDERVLTAALSNRLKELAALATVGKAVNSVLNLTQVLNIILSSALELLSADGGSIMLLEGPHELRTPLTSILGCVQTMQRRELEPEINADFLETIDRQSHRLLRLIEEVLDVQRSATGPLLQSKTIDVAQAVAQVATTQASLGREVSVRVDGSLTIDGDPEALERVLINLVDNAFVHGQGPVAIEATADDDGRMVRLSVLDHGPGVPVSDVARVVERF